MDDGRQTTVSNCRRLSSVVRFPTMPPTTTTDLQSAVRDSARVRLHGAGTKFASTSVADADALDLSGLRGIIDYQPNEFIVQAWAGTPVREVADLLAASGQYLPFDPLLVDAGATLGGTIAANASGPERFRYGGVRDFLIGCHFIDGRGELLTGGGKVVKNAAGFDYPKLFVGSRGSLGILTDVCFKVFPQPETYQTLVARFADLPAALAALNALTAAPLDIHALDLAVDGDTYALEVRVGGLHAGMDARMERVRSTVRSSDSDILRGDDEAAHWRRVREFEWIAGPVAKIPLTPARIPTLNAVLLGARRYSVGGNVAWAGADDSLDAALRTLGMHGQIFRGADAGRALGGEQDNAFAHRVRLALDPQQKFR
jgi:glycolate oxidase FAD binding subunit